MILLYDNTFDGLLTAIFEVYRLKIVDFEIVPTQQYQEKLFDPLLRIRTNKAKANRIKLGIKRKTSEDQLPFFSYIFAEKEEKELLIYQIIQQVFSE